jgi:sirohydrochlorin cobaltochelatase
MKVVIVLAMHGTPPAGFPEHELGELFSLHSRMERASGSERESLQERHDLLDSRIRNWPRDPQNDPFYAGSLDLADHLRQAAGCDVIVGFNEFCAPSVDEAIEQAVTVGAEKVVVVTPMMTRGGSHSEEDIPAAIARACARYPRVPVLYAWPFDTSEVALFLTAQVERSR